MKNLNSVTIKRTHYVLYAHIMVTKIKGTQLRGGFGQEMEGSKHPEAGGLGTLEFSVAFLGCSLGTYIKIPYYGYIIHSRVSLLW